jgi:hypothetical protein
MAHRDISGVRFGKLIAEVIDDSNAKRLTKWICKCDCGAKSSVYMTNLVRGLTKSCGCSQTSQFLKHAMYGKKAYRAWGAMIQRCYNPNAAHYDRYGGRGITVSDDWKDFQKFYADMGDPDGLTLDRIDNNKGYSKENCQWATRKEQTRNRSNTVTYEHDGLALTLDEWSEKLGVSRECLRGRIRRGKSYADVFGN